MTDEELTRQARIVKRNRSIPYGDLNRAVAIGREAFPNADDVTYGLYDGLPLVTIWNAGRGIVRHVDIDAGVVMP